MIILSRETTMMMSWFFFLQLQHPACQDPCQKRQLQQPSEKKWKSTIFQDMSATKKSTKNNENINQYLFQE